MILHAFAKINWSLDITGVREDGYHFMDMIMQPVSLYDEIVLRPASSLSITTGGFPRSRPDESNLAWQAADLLRRETGYAGGASIHVHKSIPIGAGMGGGSADAAAVLFGLNRLWNTGLSAEQLEHLGLQLGADVPFALRGGLARTRGIGECLENHTCRYHYWLILWQPCSGLSTGKVFSLWEDTPALDRPDIPGLLDALSGGNFAVLCKSLGNVLQPVSSQLRPEIGTACHELMVRGAAAAVMTGIGSAVFGIFQGETAAKKAFLSFGGREKAMFLSHTQDDSIRIMEE